jgi:hypothetical protein
LNRRLKVYPLSRFKSKNYEITNNGNINQLTTNEETHKLVIRDNTKSYAHETITKIRHIIKYIVKDITTTTRDSHIPMKN